MTETKLTCPGCRKTLPPHVPLGLCPECLIKAGFNTGTEPHNPGGKTRFVPPAVAALATHFPQLEILELVGQGGMGAVYKARQPKLDRIVALKILSSERETGISDAEFAERFQREARALARLNHPDIVAVYDFGQAGGFHYLLMEFVDGLTLRQLLRTRKLSPEEALTIVPKICEALQFAHEHGIVHRDIKPENILLDKSGRVKIADFGIAKIVGATAEKNALTGAKDVLGTPHYMAPEQLEKPATVDHRADIFSLGVVFYEMLTGELPLGKFLSPSRKVQMDVRLDEVVLHALEKEPERRYQHASEVKVDVETIAATRDSQPRSESGQAASAPAAKAPSGEGAGRWLGFSLVEERGGRPVVLWLGVFIAWTVCFGVVALVLPLTWIAVGRQLGAVLSLPQALALGWGGSTLLIFTGVIMGLRRPTRPPGDRPPVGPASRLILTMRWVARALGTLLLAFYCFFILAEGLPPIAAQPEGVQLNFVALGLMLAGFAAGWKREGTAALLITSGWALWQISENAIRWNLFQTPLPVGMLYGFCWWATRGRRTNVVLSTVVALVAVLGLGRWFLPTSVFVRGAVVDAQTRQPVPNVEMRLLPRQPGAHEKGDPPNARGNAQGRFNLYVGWYGANRSVEITAPGYAKLTTNLGPRPLGERNVSRDYQLEPAKAASVGAAPPVPPVVIETVPPSGAAGIDPALAELRVTFSQPMRDGSWSWTKWGEGNFPEMTGQPRFLADSRTCVLPVKLRPGQVYAIWLNSEWHQDFKDAAGQAAVPYLLIFQTRP